MFEIELVDGPAAGKRYRLSTIVRLFEMPYLTEQGRIHKVIYRWTGEIREDSTRVFEYEGTQ